MNQQTEVKLQISDTILKYKNGNIKYKGGFLDGKANGKGIGYYESGKKWYEGEWINNKYEGNGKLYYKNGNLGYEGEWKNSFREGKGIEYYTKSKDKGIKWEGEFKDNMPYTGKGYWHYYDDVEFKGEWKNGCPINGEGCIKYESGNYFRGEIKDGKKFNGKGIIDYTNGNKFIGELKNGDYYKGKLIHKNGDYFDGEWKDGKPYCGIELRNGEKIKWEGKNGISMNKNTFLQLIGFHQRKLDYTYCGSYATVRATNPISGERIEKNINGLTKEMVESWKNGERIQIAMPNLSRKDREFLISGI